MAARVYTHREFVDGADVGPNGSAHLDSIADWLQEAAFADGTDAGLGTASGWVIRRTSLRVERSPRFAERLTLRTWCGALAASVAERLTTIEGDSGALVHAEAVWVHIDPATRRPARFPAEFLAAYAESAGEGRPRTKLRHPSSPPTNGERSRWQFSRADIDLADHVNNSVYWRVAEEHLLAGGSPADGLSLEAEYRSGVGSGDTEVVLAADRSMAWVLGEDGSVAASLSVAAGV